MLEQLSKMSFHTIFLSCVFFVNLNLSFQFDNCNVAACFRGPQDDYVEKRNALIEAELMMETGSNIPLDSAEKKLNELLMRYKLDEITVGFATDLFPPSVNFLKAKSVIEKSKVYKMMKLMPKGAALHLHDTSFGDAHWVVKNVTYRPHCYVCFNKSDGRQHMKFFKMPPSTPDCPWRLVSDIRASYPSIQAYDEELYANLTIVTSDPDKAYPSGKAVWNKFSSIFVAITDMIFYKDVFVDYFYEGLKRMYADNVQYMELRALLAPMVYDLDGNLYDEEWMMQTYYNITQKFRIEYPYFSGVRIILSQSRHLSPPSIKPRISLAMKLLKEYPDFFSGYDLVGWEQRGEPLIAFISELLAPSQMDPPVYLPYFFHAGETDWEGTSVDENLYDAVLLNASRIGHAYAVVKHPKVLEMLKKKDIPIEVNPISNQVLHLVNDLRNHPATFLLANNYSIVISSDDPGMWGADPLSHDFYEIFMGSASARADLRLLKRLAINSIRYSSMSSEQKKRAYDLWTKKWTNFVHEALQLFRIN